MAKRPKKKQKSKPLPKVEPQIPQVQEKVPDWKKDLSSNLGNIMKPSIPDFGYAEHMYFGDEDRSNSKRGWGRFLEFIQKYPVTNKAQNIIENIKKEKDLEGANLRTKKKRSKLKKRVSYSIKINKASSDIPKARGKKSVYFEDMKMQGRGEMSTFRRHAEIQRRKLPSILPQDNDITDSLRNLSLSQSESKNSLSSSNSSINAQPPGLGLNNIARLGVTQKGGQKRRRSSMMSFTSYNNMFVENRRFDEKKKKKPLTDIW
eukprot:CAMPEP_0197017394 /NCGR_PEP_ID=MMETSP1380-20130617/79516_1 /TAXON_ID=5936 /ORGANISM="Euplotes crassus, Strain CT5" /LENGTH=260 /DNA_ID=CAMNT_0042444487 /DNA_START=169 /DNA_END=948 /DNA_ORIENTATION=-